MKATRKYRPVLGDLLVALAILAVAGALLLTLLPSSENARIVRVTVNGKPVWTCSLENQAEPIVYTVAGEYPMTLALSADGVRVVETSCPGEDCRHMGLISRTGQQIVCLPNRTVITLDGANPSFDAVTG